MTSTWTAARKALLWGTGLSVLLNGGLLVCLGGSTHWWGAPPVLQPLWIAISVLLSCVAVTRVVALPFLLSRRTRAGALIAVAVALPIVAPAWFVESAAHDLRWDGVARLCAEDPHPVIAAIRAYEAERGEPPKTLEALVPQWLPEIPSTGFAAYPDYLLTTGDDARRRYDGSDWVLRVQTPLRSGDWDELMYRSTEDYPESTHGAVYWRFGAWADFHE